MLNIDANFHVTRLTDQCLELHYNDSTFIVDISHIHVAPSDNFCRACWIRRYNTHINAGTRPIQTEPEDNMYHIAKVLSSRPRPEDDFWQTYSVKSSQPVATYKLFAFEDCPDCNPDRLCSRSDAEEQYRKLLTERETGSIERIMERTSSFGFISNRYISDKIGLKHNRFDPLMGGNFEARLLYRIIDHRGRSKDSAAIGFDKDRLTATVKATMEYIERYTFLLQISGPRTKEHDDKIIADYLSLYTETTKQDHDRLKQEAFWAINLLTDSVVPVPTTCIYNDDPNDFIQPTTSGFAAHVQIEQCLINSILEIIERDAFVRFWHKPETANLVQPDEKTASELDTLCSYISIAFDNPDVCHKMYIIHSPLQLPAVMLILSSRNFYKPPAITFGLGAGLNLKDAINSAMTELRQYAINQVKGIELIPGFLRRRVSRNVESIPDRMNLYATSKPRRKLKFLDRDIGTDKGMFQPIDDASLTSLLKRFEDTNIDILAIDCTPACFSDAGSIVTRAFSPQLYPLQFQHERRINLPVSEHSCADDLPHFFI